MKPELSMDNKYLTDARAQLNIKLMKAKQRIKKRNDTKKLVVSQKKKKSSLFRKYINNLLKNSPDAKKEYLQEWEKENAYKKKHRWLKCISK